MTINKFLLVLFGILLMSACSKNDIDDPKLSYDTLPDCQGGYRLLRFMNNGSENAYSYDSQGKVIKRTLLDSSEVVYCSYDGDGRVVGARRYQTVGSNESLLSTDTLLYNNFGHLRQRIRTIPGDPVQEIYIIQTDSQGRIVSDSSAHIPLFPVVQYYTWSPAGNVTEFLVRAGGDVYTEATYTYDDNPNPLSWVKDVYIATGGQSNFYLSANNCVSSKVQVLFGIKQEANFTFQYHPNGLPKSRTPVEFQYLYECQ